MFKAVENKIIFSLQKVKQTGKFKAESSVNVLTGGEVRVETPSKLVHAALVMEGVNLTSSALPAVYVLQQALGGMSFVQHGSNSSSKILKAASAVTGQPFTVSTTLLY